MAGPSHRSLAYKPGGFTLLELMLVIFIVGIIAALAMPNLALQDDSEKLRESAGKLRTLMQLQEEEAILTGTQRGLRIFQQDREGELSFRYRWMVWATQEGAWQAAPEQMRQLEGAIDGVGDLVLRVEGKPVEIEQELQEKRLGQPSDTGKASKQRKGEKAPAPQIILFSSGEITDFEISLSSADGLANLILTGGYEGLLLKDEAEQGTRN